MTTHTADATLAHRAPPKPPLRVVTDDFGRPLQVFVGSLDITHLVVRPQTVTTTSGTQHEVVLSAVLPSYRREARA